MHKFIGCGEFVRQWDLEGSLSNVLLLIKALHFSPDKLWYFVLHTGFSMPDPLMMVSVCESAEGLSRQSPVWTSPHRGECMAPAPLLALHGEADREHELRLSSQPKCGVAEDKRQRFRLLKRGEDFDQPFNRYKYSRNSLWVLPCRPLYPEPYSTFTPYEVVTSCMLFPLHLTLTSSALDVENPGYPMLDGPLLIEYG